MISAEQDDGGEGREETGRCKRSYITPGSSEIQRDEEGRAQALKKDRKGKGEGAKIEENVRRR
jgi:hypothetical protein